nr:MAG TPA: hypothetical protein [Caudoviricetes sp.]DAK19684.1 MAG TPA: hypothetical protein [Caudoviricetes sp.]
MTRLSLTAENISTKIISCFSLNPPFFLRKNSTIHIDTT